jgi:hypothetical protein
VVFAKHGRLKNGDTKEIWRSSMSAWQRSASSAEAAVYEHGGRKRCKQCWRTAVSMGWLERKLDARS